MNYLDAVEILKEIENKYDVMSVRFKGVSAWPYLRCYLVDVLGYNKARKASLSNVSFILKNLFRYNPLSIRKKMDIWSYSGVITRKQIGDKYIHHASGVLTEISEKVLNFENPEVSRPHFPHKSIPEKYIISNSWSIFLSRAFEYFLRIGSLKVENIEILEHINKDYEIDFDYNFRLRLLYAQKLATDLLLTVGKHPKLVVMECPYDQLGYVWSFHCHNIPVIELQHGVLNENHYAYNSIYYADTLAPDVLCVYGDQEYDFITNRSVPFCKEVYKTGLYILDCADKYFNEDIFKNERKSYNEIIVVAGQTDCEHELLSFIEAAAKLSKQLLFVYIPRRKCNLDSQEDNVRVVFDVNIYQYLKWCDIHCTVSSTTCLEAQYFRKPNIFIELNNTAKNYYGKILTEQNGSFFSSTIPDFLSRLFFIVNHRDTFRYKALFAKDSFNLTRNVINKYIK